MLNNIFICLITSPRLSLLNLKMSEANWRDHLLTGREQFHYVFQNSLFSDVKFLVGSSQTPVHSHSFVLKVRSPVFERLLEKLPLNGPVREIVIQNASTIGFKKFIQFLYTDQLEASAHEALEILPLAKKYRVSALSTRCVTLLGESIREDNAASIFQLARDSKEIELEQKAIQFIQNNAAQVFSGTDYRNLTNDNLCYFLKMDELDISEGILFKALIEWGKVECVRHTLKPTPKHIRMVTKDAVHFIRFPIMTLKEFKETVVPEDILSEKEMKAVIKYLEANVADREFVKPTLFSTTKRNVLHEGEIDLSKTDDEAHKRLAKFAISKSNPQEGTGPLTVTSLILEIDPRDNTIELDTLKSEIFKIKKYGLFWGASNEVELPNGMKKLRISFAADIRRSYGVGTVVEAVLDLESFVSDVFVYSYKDEIIVHI